MDDLKQPTMIAAGLAADTAGVVDAPRGVPRRRSRQYDPAMQTRSAWLLAALLALASCGGGIFVSWGLDGCGCPGGGCGCPATKAVDNAATTREVG